MLAEIAKSNGAPELWVIDAFDPDSDATVPLAIPPNGSQYPANEQPERAFLRTSLEEIVFRQVFGRDIADQLRRERLRYMYQLPFLFYCEARPAPPRAGLWSP